MFIHTYTALLYVPVIITVTTGPIAVYHFSLIWAMTAAIAVAIISSIEMMDSARTALSHGMEAIHKSKYTQVITKVTATINTKHVTYSQFWCI